MPFYLARSRMICNRPSREGGQAGKNAHVLAKRGYEIMDVALRRLPFESRRDPGSVTSTTFVFGLFQSLPPAGLTEPGVKDAGEQTEHSGTGQYP